jgi:hypothetical protein
LSLGKLNLGWERTQAAIKIVACSTRSSYSDGPTIFVADAHRDGNHRFIVRTNEKLTPFVELESAIHRAITTTIG